MTMFPDPDRPGISASDGFCEGHSCPGVLHRAAFDCARYLVVCETESRYFKFLIADPAARSFE